MKLTKVFGGLAVAVAVFSITAQDSLAALSRDQRLADFNQAVSIIERNYGPLQWKETSIGLDWKKNVELYREKIATSNSDTKFYQTISQFLSSLQDAHVSAQVPSTYRASLGFLCDYVEGKVLIETIDTLRMPEALFPFKKGDQLVALGGVPVEKIMAELSLVNNTGHKESQLRIDAARLTSRKESSGLAVPRGVTTVTVLPKGAAQPVTVTATWITRGTPIIELDDLSKLLDGSSMATIVPATTSDSLDFMNDLKKLSLFNMKLPQAKLQEWASVGVNDIGSPKSMFKLPEGAKEIEGLPMTGAIYESAGKKIGILRIPAYDSDELLQNVARAIIQMEKETDVLVLDQTNNPGGAVSLVSDLISIFADRSYVDMNFVIRPSLAWVDTFSSINQQIAGMIAADPQDMAANALKARFEYLEQEMRDSLVQRKFLTAPVSLDLTGRYGMILPQPEVRYTKPVLLLINEFDFSGGDAFPALMKDNGRVTLFGARTSGAGGNVAAYGPLANSFFKFYLTESLMVRPNGQFMENLGVSPDISYQVTEDDFMNGYRNYVKAFTTEALKLVGVGAAEIKAYEEEQAKIKAKAALAEKAAAKAVDSTIAQEEIATP